MCGCIYLPHYLFCQCFTVPPSLQSIESGRNLVALSCSIKLVNAIVSAEKRDTPITDVRNAVYIGTSKWAALGFVLCCFVFITCLSTWKHVYSTLHSEGSRRGREERKETQTHQTTPVKHKQTNRKWLGHSGAQRWELGRVCIYI